MITPQKTDLGVEDHDTLYTKKIWEKAFGQTQVVWAGLGKGEGEVDLWGG